LDNLWIRCEPLVESLGRFSGRRALIVETERDSLVPIVSRRFESVECIRVPPVLAPPPRPETSARNTNVTVLADTSTLPFGDSEFDVVYMARVSARVKDWRVFIKECTRVLHQRASLVVIENNSRVLNEQQLTLLELERLLLDRDIAISGHSLTVPTVDEIRAELRVRDIHHLRVVDYGPQDLSWDAAARFGFKRECLDRLKNDLIPSLGRAGSRRDEFERRLIDVKRRIEIGGVEPPNFTLLFGMKKTSYATTAPEASLFAAETLSAADAAVAEPPTEVAMLPVPPPTAAPEIESMTTPDLLSLVMSAGESTHRYAKLAQRVVKEYGSRAVADERDPDRLSESLKISRPRALQIVAAFELGRRFFARSGEDFPILRGPEDVFRHAADMANLRREQFRGLYLNSRQRLVADEVISIGTLTSAILHPREVFRPAVTHRAVSVIVVHNHPSGDPEPSPEDIEMTRQLAAAGQTLGIELLDHLIIGSENWYSLKEAGLF
jgi:DNA repair protein RadC